MLVSPFIVTASVDELLQRALQRAALKFSTCICQVNNPTASLDPVQRNGLRKAIRSRLQDLDANSVSRWRDASLELVVRYLMTRSGSEITAA